jgi:hypothetical protein
MKHYWSTARKNKAFSALLIVELINKKRRRHDQRFRCTLTVHAVLDAISN